MKTWFTDTFGFERSTYSTVTDEIKSSSPISPIEVKTGKSSTYTHSKSGSSSKPISSYFKKNASSPLESSGGIKINLSGATFDINFGLFNISVSGSITRGDIVTSLKARFNTLSAKGELESSSSVKWDNGTIETTYTKISLNEELIVGLIILVATGQQALSPTSSPAPQYSFQ